MFIVYRLLLYCIVSYWHENFHNLTILLFQLRTNEKEVGKTFSVFIVLGQ